MDRILRVRVVPRAKKNDIKTDAGGYKVYLTAAPTDGKANKALLKLLADHLNVKRSQLMIIRGEKSRDKAIKIAGL